MSAPRKPWEEAGINTRSSVVSFDSPSRLLLRAGPPRLNALTDRDFGKMETQGEFNFGIYKTSTFASQTSNTEIKWAINVWRVKIR